MSAPAHHRRCLPHPRRHCGGRGDPFRVYAAPRAPERIETFEFAQLDRLLRAAGLEPTSSERIARYGSALLARNRSVNLTGAKTAEALLPLLLDSLSIVPFVASPHVDIGSGGGMPAIPAAILAGGDLTMIESTGKKAVFLREIASELGISARVLQERAEVAGRRPDLRDGFSTGTARAVASSPTVAELLLPLLKVGGSAILQRGTIQAEERAALEDALLVLGGKIESEHTPGPGQRILVVAKVSPTPERFPRRPGIPAKRPLGWRGVPRETPR